MSIHILSHRTGFLGMFPISPPTYEQCRCLIVDPMIQNLSLLQSSGDGRNTVPTGRSVTRINLLRSRCQNLGVTDGRDTAETGPRDDGARRQDLIPASDKLIYFLDRNENKVKTYSIENRRSVYSGFSLENG